MLNKEQEKHLLVCQMHFNTQISAWTGLLSMTTAIQHWVTWSTVSLFKPTSTKENDTFGFVRLKFNEMPSDGFPTAEMRRKQIAVSLSCTYCIELRGLLQAAALTGDLITHKIADDMRKSAVLNVHCNRSVTRSLCHTNTLSGGQICCYTGIYYVKSFNQTQRTGFMVDCVLVK